MDQNNTPIQTEKNMNTAELSNTESKTISEVNECIVSTTTPASKEPTNNCKGGAVVSFIISAISFFMGIHKMFVYDSGEHYPYKHTNAYVGGDAYNYIINSNYSTAFFVLAVGFLIFGICLLIYGELKIQRKELK